MPQTTTESQRRLDSIRVADPISASPGRLSSLDVFRGITIAGMLLVNNPGSWDSVYEPLRHAVWHGWTVTDLVFPFFVFIVGVAMTFSFGKALAAGATRGDLFLKSAKRAAIIFGIGLLLNAYPWYEAQLSTLRIPGVLQRIALAYLVATAIVLWTGPRGRAAATGAILLGYWAVLSWVPVPGGEAGVLEPGQDISAWVDRTVFGMDHLWSGSRIFDPEGLLGTFPAAATVLLGVFVGDWLRSGRDSGTIINGLVVAGVSATSLGSLWGRLFPINKALWTSSFVLLTAGLAILGLALCYWLVDVKGIKGWTWPFMVFGTNAIAAYAFASLLASELDVARLAGEGADATLKGRIYETLFASWLPPLNASLAYAVTFVLVCLAVFAVFYRRRMFFKV